MAESTPDVVARALAAAAARAKRLSHLDAAVTQMERLMNIPITPEMLPWGAAMLRQVQVHTFSCQSCRCNAHDASTEPLNSVYIYYIIYISYLLGSFYWGSS